MTDLEPTNEPDPNRIEIREQNGGFVVCYGGRVFSRVFGTLAEAEAFKRRDEMEEPRPGYVEIHEQDGGFVVCDDDYVMTNRVFATQAEAEAWRNDLPF